MQEINRKMNFKRQNWREWEIWQTVFTMATGFCRITVTKTTRDNECRANSRSKRSLNSDWSITLVVTGQGRRYVADALFCVTSVSW